MNDILNRLDDHALNMLQNEGIYDDIVALQTQNAALLDVVRDCINFLADTDPKSDRAKALHKRAYTAHSKAKDTPIAVVIELRKQNAELQHDLNGARGAILNYKGVVEYYESQNASLKRENERLKTYARTLLDLSLADTSASR